MKIAAKIVSIFLAICGTATLLVALGTIVGVAPDSGVGGVVVVDSVFGTVVLFAAARLLWLYAVRPSDSEPPEPP